jgi:hypothetical protein
MPVDKIALAKEAARYLLVLEKCRFNCQRVEEAAPYANHLAAAGVIVAEILEGCSIAYLKKLVAEERRIYLTDPLTLYDGDLASSTFLRFAASVERLDSA